MDGGGGDAVVDMPASYVDVDIQMAPRTMSDVAFARGQAIWDLVTPNLKKALRP